METKKETFIVPLSPKEMLDYQLRLAKTEVEHAAAVKQKKDITGRLTANINMLVKKKEILTEIINHRAHQVTREVYGYLDRNTNRVIYFDAETGSEVESLSRPATDEDRQKTLFKNTEKRYYSNKRTDDNTPDEFLFKSEKEERLGRNLDTDKPDVIDQIEYELSKNNANEPEVADETSEKQGVLFLNSPPVPNVDTGDKVDVNINIPAPVSTAEDEFVDGFPDGYEDTEPAPAQENLNSEHPDEFNPMDYM